MCQLLSLHVTAICLDARLVLSCTYLSRRVFDRECFLRLLRKVENPIHVQFVSCPLNAGQSSLESSDDSRKSDWGKLSERRLMSRHVVAVRRPHEWFLRPLPRSD
ncbi:hypothetical protein LIA77_00784 [Sarocladium implicatum]|nr:hypothetical protein LIA77_00784 [Sarocladium implicatum]